MGLGVGLRSGLGVGVGVADHGFGESWLGLGVGEGYSYHGLGELALQQLGHREVELQQVVLDLR